MAICTTGLTLNFKIMTWGPKQKNSAYINLEYPS